jgi:HSP20 family protein
MTQPNTLRANQSPRRNKTRGWDFGPYRSTMRRSRIEKGIQRQPKTEGGIMTNLPVRHQPRAWLPDLSGFWSDLWTGFPSWAGLRPLIDTHLIRLEDEMADGHYLLRAELPGIDPAKDVDITVSNGQLTIKAERSEKKETKGRSEFSYGSFTRSVTLPAGANEDDIKASYDKGILTVDVTVPEQAKVAEKHIAVQAAS